MEHYSAGLWLRYIDGQVEADQAGEMECHLAQCDSCLKLYTLAAESCVTQEVSSQFTHEVMARVAASGLKSKLPRSSGNRRQSLVNYAVAACLTLFLTAGGIFSNVATALPAVTLSKISLADTAAQKVGSGWSEVIAKKTLSIVDILKPE